MCSYHGSYSNLTCQMDSFTEDRETVGVSGNSPSAAVVVLLTR